MAATGGFRPLIFISHSARKDRKAYDNLTIVRDHLIGAGFDVLIDETRIDGNEDWRNCINTWLAHCHGGQRLLAVGSGRHAVVVPFQDVAQLFRLGEAVFDDQYFVAGYDAFSLTAFHGLLLAGYLPLQ